MTAPTIDQHIGDRIRARRAELGLTQDQLATGLAISYQQIQKYESGSNRISAARLFKLAQRLDVPIGYFFEDVAIEREAAAGGVEPGKPRPTVDLIRGFSEIDSNDVRLAVTGLLRAVAERQA
jgi:transcriptional regulator with XRE-family HTH domain